jgi:spermidine/putrescine transport system ATP-binding protein
MTAPVLEKHRWAKVQSGGVTSTETVRRGAPILDLSGLSHSYDGFSALDDVALAVWSGEFLTLLGPSGSGKTTLLRIIAGLEEPSVVGRIVLAGQDVRDVPANERNVATVFQHFALFPHMSVGQNVEYGLRVRRLPLAERRERALHALRLVRLADKYARRVHQLSGGEKQRVALARAFVTEPDILLLDEPLGSLDERLRVEMQLELIELHRELGATFVLVTHSQEEAITMSDRIVLMRDGRIVQQGSPQSLFERPQSRFAAEFMGVENLLDGEVIEVDNRRARLRIGEGMVEGAIAGESSPMPGERVFAAIRAEHVRFHESMQGICHSPNAFPCQLRARVYKGKYQDLTAETPIGSIVGRIWDGGAPSPSYLSWPAEKCVVGPLTG